MKGSFAADHQLALYSVEMWFFYPLYVPADGVGFCKVILGELEERFLNQTPTGIEHGGLNSSMSHLVKIWLTESG